MIRQPRRGLQSIKTRGAGPGATCESSSRHSIYLKLAMLEMERERRAKEQVTSNARAAGLVKRMGEIESEVIGLQKQVAASEGVPPPEPPRVDAEGVPRPTLPRRTRMFRF